MPSPDRSALALSPYHRGQPVPASALQPWHDACPLCGNGTTTRTPVLTLQTDPPVHLAACSACGGASASRLPDPDWLRLWYGSYYGAMGTDSGSGHTFEQPHRLARHLWRWLGRARPGAVLHILDFGSGDGALGLALGARWAEQHQRLTQVTLVDHHPHAAFSHPQVRLHTRTELDGTIPPADLVLASAILEHVHAPEQVLGALVDRLAPGGLLYARTPWMLPIARLLSKVDFGYPAHLHDLGPAWWNGVARRHGWPVRALASRPSIVETTLRTHPVRALAAHVLKVPGHLESWLRGPESTGHRWGWVGGWEVVWQRAADVAV